MVRRYARLPARYRRFPVGAAEDETHESTGGVADHAITFDRSRANEDGGPGPAWPGLVRRGPERPHEDPRVLRRPARVLGPGLDVRDPRRSCSSDSMTGSRRRASRRSLELDRLLAVGRDPETDEPFESPTALFDVYLARNVPSSEEALLTFVDGSSTARPWRVSRSTACPHEVLTDWADLSSELPRRDRAALPGRSRPSSEQLTSAFAGSSSARAPARSSSRSFPPRSWRRSASSRRTAAS